MHPTDDGPLALTGAGLWPPPPPLPAGMVGSHDGGGSGDGGRAPSWEGGLAASGVRKRRGRPGGGVGWGGGVGGH